jgi:excisionase family DNA binding protein
MAERRVIPIDEIASEMLISRSMVYKLIAAGELRTIHVGRRHLVKLDSYLEFLERGSSPKRRGYESG